MQTIPEEQVLRRMRAENVWWSPPHQIADEYRQWKPRAYLKLFCPLVRDTSVRRAVLLMGPRRVGKTVLVHHTIQKLLDEGLRPTSLCYLSVDHPIYNGLGLEQLLEYFRRASGAQSPEPCFVFFDEIQYLRNWEVHLKTLVDTHPVDKFVACGSAAAALRLKSAESGAGRFTDFLLPPLTFHDYLDLLDIEKDLIELQPAGKDHFRPRAKDVHALNESFIRYLNFGGYPEVIFSPRIQSDPGRFIKSDIIDKVLLRDLPSLYGIQDIQELNYLFTTLAFNTANEISLEELSKNSGVAKNTLKRYIEYLEAAFLLKIVHRIDRTAKRFQRANFFKVYLTNPSLRSALFSPVDPDDDLAGKVVETGIFAQWFHLDDPRYYARWADGEVDIVGLRPDKQKASWAVEVKWSDRAVAQPNELDSLFQFCDANGLKEVLVTTRSREATEMIRNVKVTFLPASLYCFVVGYNLVAAKQRQVDPKSAPRLTIRSAAT